MAYFLSTGTTITIAAATGDASQLGMALGFAGLVRRLIRGAHPATKDRFGNFGVGDFNLGVFDFKAPSRIADLGSDRPRPTLYLWGTTLLGAASLGFANLALGGSEALQQCLRYLTQPSVYQH